MDNYRKWGLWLRIALPFLLFVVAGSVILVVWLYVNARNESRALFVTLARTNADFIRSSHLPTSSRMAAELGRILDMQVCFRDPNGMIESPGADLKDLQANLLALSPSQGVAPLDSQDEATVAAIDENRALILIRPVRGSGPLLLRPATQLILLSFWTLSLVLAWTLTRGVVRPLRILAQHLPQIEREDTAQLPGTERNDEIGLLARTYTKTHLQLLAERKRREQAERLALLGKMAAGLAHEINNPLSSIRMHTQLLETSMPRDAADGAIPVILGEAAKIEGLVNQWMFLARPAPPQITTVDLAELVSGVVKSMLPQARHARVTIQEKIPRGLVVHADARRIAQVAGNIILNAIQAMPSGGTLDITGQPGPPLSVAFEDTGGGFTEKALARYADLFFSEKEGGMGIGLSVSSEIIKAHGGSMDVANRDGKGARVCIQFPAEKPEL